MTLTEKPSQTDELTLADLKPGDIFKIVDTVRKDEWDTENFNLYGWKDMNGQQHFTRLPDGAPFIVIDENRFKVARYKQVGEWRVEREE